MTINEEGQRNPYSPDICLASGHPAHRADPPTTHYLLLTTYYLLLTTYYLLLTTYYLRPTASAGGTTYPISHISCLSSLLPLSLYLQNYNACERHPEKAD